MEEEEEPLAASVEAGLPPPSSVAESAAKVAAEVEEPHPADQSSEAQGVRRKPAPFSLESLGQGTSRGAGAVGGDEPGVVVGVLEEVEEIPRPDVPEEDELWPFEDGIFQVVFGATQEHPEPEFVFSTDEDRAAMQKGREQLAAFQETLEVILVFKDS